MRSRTTSKKLSTLLQDNVLESPLPHLHGETGSSWKVQTLGPSAWKWASPCVVHTQWGLSISSSSCVVRGVAKITCVIFRPSWGSKSCRQTILNLSKMSMRSMSCPTRNSKKQHPQPSRHVQSMKFDCWVVCTGGSSSYRP